MNIPPKYEDLVLKVAEMERCETALRESLTDKREEYNKLGDRYDALQQRLTVAEQHGSIGLGAGVTVENIGFSSERGRKPYLVFDGDNRLTELNLIDVSLVSKRKTHTVADLENMGVNVEQPAPVAVAMPDDWEDQLFAEMSRRFDLRKMIDDDHMVYDDTQIGVEFASDWIKARLNWVKP